MINWDLPVRVYWNYKHRCYSIFQAGAVRASAKTVRLKDAEFRVREGGRQKMIREQRKIIHAYAIGKLVDFVHPDDKHDIESLDGRGAFYDPYRFASFVACDNNEAIDYADLVQFDETGTHFVQYQQQAA